MLNILLYLMLLLHFHEKVCANSHVNSNDEEDSFVPTHEWQIVRKGQKIPKGLHVRVNFETGITEAKILDENDATSKTNAVVQVPDAENSNIYNPGNLKYSQEELKEALKNIKNDEVSKEYVEKIQKTFRSYEELKKDLGELNINPKTDAELLKELISYHKKITKTRKNEDLVITILEDLEYLTHQIDNANDFVILNGFVDVIYPNLNSTNLEIKAGSLKLLGSCMQNNPKVQIHALETGAIGIILKVLVLSPDHIVKNRAVFALGSLMRRFPLAQLTFIENAGLNVFGELLQKSIDIKLLLKIITLINDLYIEHIDALQDLSNTEKVQQYNAVNLKQKLQGVGWCPYVIRLLENVSVDVNDHDSIEKTLHVVNSLNICKIEDSIKLQKLVLELRNYYKNLSQTDDDKYFKTLFDLCNKILLPLKYKSEL